MKKFLLLLLFIPLVSFGQEDIELNLSLKDSVKNYFGFGFKYESNLTSTESGITNRLLKNLIVIDLNYMINNFSIGAEYGRNIEGNLYFDDAIRRNLYKFGVRLGFKTSNDKFIFTSTSGLRYSTSQSPSDNYNLRQGNNRKFYTKFSIILNSNKKLVPEFGIGTDGLSLGFVHFFKSKSSRNKKLKDNNDIYTELKKLNELLELGIITQEEYVKKAEKLKKVILD